MFHTLKEVGVIASAVFIGVTASTVMQTHAFHGDHNPYSHLCWSMTGLLAVIAAFDIYRWFQYRRFENMLKNNVGDCCQSQKKGSKRGK